MAGSRQTLIQSRGHVGRTADWQGDQGSRGGAESSPSLGVTEELVNGLRDTVPNGAADLPRLSGYERDIDAEKTAGEAV